jgi:hypothetical protein
MLVFASANIEIYRARIVTSVVKCNYVCEIIDKEEGGSRGKIVIFWNSGRGVTRDEWNGDETGLAGWGKESEAVI